MSDRFKIVYIGAGSFRFSIVLFMDICRAVEFSPIEVALVDIDSKSLDMMTKVLTNMAKKAKRKNRIDIKVTATTDITEALENADFVYKSISVGIQEAEWFDNYLPYKLGIPQNTGDTVGPGGVFRSLRTNHVVADIARDMKKLCPKAPLLNYTNPQATIVMSARTVAPDIQYIGLCHELFGGMKSIQEVYNKFLRGNDNPVKNWEDLDFEYGGVNHFAWLTKIEYNGKDLYPDLRKLAHQLVLDKFKRPFNFYLLEKYGWFPYPGSRHVAEFIPDYYNYFNHEIQSPYWSFPKLRNVAQLDKMRHLAYWIYRRAAQGIVVPKPRNSGEKAIDMTIDWKKDIPNKYVVNIPNKGIIPELPEDSIVEVPAYFKRGEITPVGTIHLDKNIAELLRPHAEQQRMTVNAALGNDPDLIIKAMQHDPMCAWIEDPDRIDYLTKLMLYYEQEWLPQKWKEWIPTESELMNSKYWVSSGDLSRKGKKYLKKKYSIDEELRNKAFFWH